jgi:prolyl-tRNA editing enzyme YbaK/EbsC (Cys-tRNA(Pro) deacylase)
LTAEYDRDQPVAGDPALRLAAFVAGAGIDAEVLFPDGPTATVAEAAATLNVPPTRIVKSLLFASQGGDYLLVVACGEAKIDRKRLATLAGLPKLKLASPATVLAVTGCAVGGMPPVGHGETLPVIVDRAVLAEPMVYGGGGRIDAVLRILPDDIVRLNRATLGEVTEAAT